MKRSTIKANKEMKGGLTNLKMRPVDEEEMFV